MYADSPATNVLARDRERSLRALVTADQHPVALVSLLRAKRTVLWVVVTVPCLLAALATGVADHRPVVTAATIVGIVVLPLGPLTLAGCVGLMLPYHPLPLRVRWEHRRAWREQLRWVVLVAAPYAVVPFLLGLTTLPSIALWHAAGPPAPAPIPDRELAGLVGLACAVSLVLAAVGDRLTGVLVHARRRALIAYLERPAP